MAAGCKLPVGGGNMSTGTVLLFSGIAVLAMAVILTIGVAATASRSKKRIEARMKEKY